LAVIGDDLYVDITIDARSTIERIPLADPSKHTVAAQLSSLGGALIPKGLDDLTAVGPHTVVAAGFVSGELLRVDLSSGSACVLASGLELPTSVRRPIGFGGFDANSDLFVTEASGRVLHVHLG
jgi:hypothetical protein